MTPEEAEKLNAGLYLIFWKNGSVSKAVLSLDVHGKRVINCHNWIGRGNMLLYYVVDIEKMIFIL